MMEEADNYIENIILKYFSKKASTEEIEKLDIWINESEEHMEAFVQLKNIWEVSNPPFDPDSINTEKAYQEVVSQIHKQRKKRKSFLFYWQRIAAVMILPLLFVSVYFYLNVPIAKQNIVYQEIFTPYGSRSYINLPDSSGVWLNAGSSLKYPVKFYDGERRVYLKGEAYFDVEADKKNPFIVETNNMDVVATGTAFNVEAYNSDTVTSVTLVRGQVNLKFNKNDVILKPGEKIAFNSLTSNYEMDNSNAYKWYSWKDGILAFRNDPLEYVFKRLGHTYNINFIIKDKGLKNYVYHATFEDESLDEILELLKISTPIYYKKVGTRKDNNNFYHKQIIEVHKRH